MARSKLDHYLSLGIEDHTEEGEESPTVPADETPTPPPVEHVSEDEADDARDESEEVREEMQENHREYQEEVADQAEAQQAVEALEHYADVLEHGLNTQQYSPQTIALIQQGLEDFGERFGGHEEVASLEHFAEDDYEGYYRASLESITGFVNRVRGSIKREFNNTLKRMAKASENDDKVIKAFYTRADAVLNTVAKASAGEVTVSVGKGTNLVRCMGGQNLVDTFAAVGEKNITTAKYLTSKVFPSVVDYQAKVGEILGNMLATSTSNQDANVKKLLDLTHPVTQVNEQYRKTGEFSYNVAVGAEDPKVGETLKERAKGVRKTTDLVLEPTTPDAKSAKEDVTMSVAEIKKVAQQTKQLAALMDVVGKTRQRSTNEMSRSTRMLDKQSKSHQTAENTDSYADAAAFDQAGSMLVGATLLTAEAGWDITSYISSVVKDLLGVLEKATKELDKKGSE